jgi:hypothetical protein
LKTLEMAKGKESVKENKRDQSFLIIPREASRAWIGRSISGCAPECILGSWVMGAAPDRWDLCISKGGDGQLY